MNLRAGFRRAALAALLLMAGAVPSSYANQPQTGIVSGPFATPLTMSMIDSAASAEWVNGVERPLTVPYGVLQMFWTQTTSSSVYLLQYGASPQPGIRHMRLGFTRPIAIGSILVRGGDQLSVLRTTAPYPGNLADDSQWLTAQRIVKGRVSTAQVDRDSYALWLLPPGTSTRALRFTHVAAPTDTNFAGGLGGVYLFSNRLVNLAPQSVVTVSSDQEWSGLLTDENHNGWHTWDNGPDFRHPVTANNPEWIVLSWPRAVSLSGLAVLWGGFNAADTQIFTGSDNVSPRSAPEADWHFVGQPWAFHNQYPRNLGIDWMDFGKTVLTRAVRLRITAVTDESHHPHLTDKTRNGTRVWLGELMALSPLQAADLHAALLSSAADNTPKPPIPVQFTLDSPGYVTLVIDDAKGNRVRNLVSDTWFEAGRNTVWWDGTDDLGRNPDAALHGVYLIPTHYVSPGSYKVRGLYHKAIELHYEFSVYNSGHPAWETPDKKGGWLTNHTPPSSTLYLPPDKAPGGKPLVYLGSYISEGGAGLAWVDLDGNKQGGRASIGAAYTAAPYLARDTGSHANPDAYIYVGGVWGEAKSKTDKQQVGAVRITALTARGEKAIVHYQYDPQGRVDHDNRGGIDWSTQMGGLAVHDNLAVVSLCLQGQLLFFDLTDGRLLGSVPAEHPEGLAFDPQGRLLVLSGKRLLRYLVPAGGSQFQSQKLASPETVISEKATSEGLEDPAGITLDSRGNIYISDRGNSNQVKIFTTLGKFLGVIGHAGPSQAGPYDQLHMNNPRGLSIDNNNRLWVAEEDFWPKRVSLWTLDGKLVKAFYGPPAYGGGGTIDPRDKTLFYYSEMEFKLDWKAGTDTLATILYRPGKNDIPLPLFTPPTTALYSNGHRYFTNAYMGHPTNGATVAVLYLDNGGTVRPVAAFGRANDWNLLQGDAFKSGWPPGADLVSKAPDKMALFTWSDANNNSQVDPAEVSYLKSSSGYVTLGPDLAFIDALVEGKAVRYAATRVTAAGIPIYDLKAGKVIAEGAQKPRSDGGGQILYSPTATVLTTAPLPFSQDGIGGVDDHGHLWSYPSLWPGLHPSHTAPVPDHPSELMGTTRLIGGFINPKTVDAGPIWGINGNLGNVYLFTADGLFIDTLFEDSRIGKPWSMPEAARNMLMNDVSLHDENFFPSLNQAQDGNVYLVDGFRTSIVRVDGLETLRRIPGFVLEVTQSALDRSQNFVKQAETQRHDTAGPKNLEVTLRAGSPPTLSGVIGTLNSANWATIDSRSITVGFNQTPDVAEAALTVAGGRLIAAFRTHEPKLLLNSGAMTNAPFKTGGALDLMIGANPLANPKRDKPVEGDQRLLVYQVGGKTKATLYRAVKPGTINPVPFSSPDRTITLDEVVDVSNLVELYAAPGADSGSYVFSIPLDALGLKPVAGQTIEADIGILRGDGTQTLQRVYWSNKATGITSDVPSEAALTPGLWGQWTFKASPQ